jgi:histone deacetylase 6
VTADTSAVGKYEEEDVDRPGQTEELAGYLWDNYIEYDSNLEKSKMG